MGTRDLSSDTNSRRILLIGDINRAFLDADAVHRLPCEIQTNMPDAIEMAARSNFAAIAVVMFGMSGKLSSALKRLREANRDARIILLAQVYEEPLAMQLVGSISNGPGDFGELSRADDYLICPIHFSYLVSRISSGPHLPRAGR